MAKVFEAARVVVKLDGVMIRDTDLDATAGPRQMPIVNRKQRRAAAARQQQARKRTHGGMSS